MSVHVDIARLDSTTGGRARGPEGGRGGGGATRAAPLGGGRSHGGMAARPLGHGMSPIWLVALAVFAVNVPFGFWRAGVRKLSLPWFVAVHAPVPLVVLMRYAAGLGFQPSTFPVLVGAFFAGQLVGGRLRSRREPKLPPGR